VALPDDNDPIAWVNYLARVHDGDLALLKELDALYQGTARLNYMHPAILRG